MPDDRTPAPEPSEAAMEIANRWFCSVRLVNDLALTLDAFAACAVEAAVAKERLTAPHKTDLALAQEAVRTVFANLRANGNDGVAEHPDLPSMIEQACYCALQRQALQFTAPPDDHHPGTP